MFESKENWAELYQQNYAEISGRKVWHWLIHTSIGQFHVIQYEKQGLEISEKVIRNDYDKAVRLFTKRCNDILNGRI